MSTLHVGWLLEEWRRKGVEVTVVGDNKLEIAGNIEQDIDRVAPLIKEHKKEILAYLIDGEGNLPGEDWPDDLLRDSIPLVCESCPRLELVNRGDGVMAGCVYKSSNDSLSFGWRRFSAGSTECIWG